MDGLGGQLSMVRLYYHLGARWMLIACNRPNAAETAADGRLWQRAADDRTLASGAAALAKIRGGNLERIARLVWKAG
ncbi:hypothetical protein [Paracoccus binzhouensis]|uniref:hypothetical protein n=1 Tax=Paracoccus binzhouensis TaxID=2796149 RepID=UPI0018EEDC38|nr:hypothetical protein [Paracoccus binzhouensis]